MKKASKPIKDKGLIFDMQEYLKYHNERNYVLFALGITTGFRSQDLVDLKVRDIEKAIKSKELCILEKKKIKSYLTRQERLKSNSNYRYSVSKPKSRSISLQPQIIKLLKQYIQDKRSYDYAFPSQKGNFIKVDSYGKILSRAGKYFGLERIAAHTPRKIYAYKLYIDSDKNIELVRRSLGHATTLITEEYLGLDREEIERISRGLNDLVII